MENIEQVSKNSRKRRKRRMKRFDSAALQLRFMERLLQQMAIRDANLTSDDPAWREDENQPNADYWSLSDKDRAGLIISCMRVMIEIRGRKELEDQLARIMANHELLIQQIRTRAPHVLEGDGRPASTTSV